MACWSNLSSKKRNSVSEIWREAFLLRVSSHDWSQLLLSGFVGVRRLVGMGILASSSQSATTTVGRTGDVLRSSISEGQGPVQEVGFIREETWKLESAGVGCCLRSSFHRWPLHPQRSCSDDTSETPRSSVKGVGHLPKFEVAGATGTRAWLRRKGWEGDASLSDWEDQVALESEEKGALIETIRHYEGRCFRWKTFPITTAILDITPACRKSKYLIAAIGIFSKMWLPLSSYRRGRGSDPPHFVMKRSPNVVQLAASPLETKCSWCWYGYVVVC